MYARAIKLVGIWNRERFPTAFQSNIVSKLKGVVEEHNLIKKTNQEVYESQKSDNSI